MFEKEYTIYIKDVSFTSKKDKVSGKSKTRAVASRVANWMKLFIIIPMIFTVHPTIMKSSLASS